MKHFWLLLTVLWLGCQAEPLPSQTDTIYDPVTGSTRQEIVSVARFAGVVIKFNHTRQPFDKPFDRLRTVLRTPLIELENENDVAVRVRLETADNAILVDKWIILSGWHAQKAVRLSREETVTITIWHLNLLLTDPIHEFSETVRL